jgi:hypothetical protein
VWVWFISAYQHSHTCDSCIITIRIIEGRKPVLYLVSDKRQVRNMSTIFMTRKRLLPINHVGKAVTFGIGYGRKIYCHSKNEEIMGPCS